MSFHCEIVYTVYIYTIYIYNLVGGFKHEFYFPFHIWDVILPIDFNSIIFQDGYLLHQQLCIVFFQVLGVSMFQPIK